MLRLLLVSMTLTVLRSTGHVFWGLLDAFLVTRLELWGETPEVKCHFHRITSRAHTVHMTDHAEVDLGHLAEVCGQGSPPRGHSSSPFAYCPPETGATAQPTPMEWEFFLISPRAGCLRTLFGILLRRRFVSFLSFVNSVIYLYQNKLTTIICFGL